MKSFSTVRDTQRGSQSYVTGKDRASCQSGGAPALRPGAVAQSAGRIDGETVETVSDFILGGSKITAALNDLAELFDGTHPQARLLSSLSGSHSGKPSPFKLTTAESESLMLWYCHYMMYNLQWFPTAVLVESKLSLPCRAMSFPILVKTPNGVHSFQR